MNRPAPTSLPWSWLQIWYEWFKRVRYVDLPRRVPRALRPGRCTFQGVEVPAARARFVTRALARRDG